jgi:hypothetical protein
MVTRKKPWYWPDQPVPADLDLTAWRSQAGGRMVGYAPGSDAPPTVYTPGYPGSVSASGGSATATATASAVALTPEQLQALLEGMFRRVNLVQFPFAVGTTAVEILPTQLTRKYLLIVNTHSTNQLFLGFDTVPTALNGLPLSANFGAYEPLMIPTNAIQVVGSGAGTTGFCVYAA